MALVLIVDDAADNRMVLSALLEDTYEVIEADSGDACLTITTQQPPDIILLDVVMPGKSGYEVCVTLKSDPATQMIPVIFVSAKDTTEERLQGFEAGADGYITKPVDGQKLLQMMIEKLQQAEHHKHTKEQAGQAMQVAMEAMTNSSELGNIIEFVRQTQQIRTAESLAAAIMTSAASFQLSACVLINTHEPVVVGCAVDDLAGQLLGKFRNHDKGITHHGIRTIIHTPQVVVLIKNMPLSDENRYGRLKDHLAILADIASGQVQLLEAEERLAIERKQMLDEIIKMTESTIQHAGHEASQQTHNIRQEVMAMVEELESMLFSLGLDEDQEKKLMHLAHRTSERLQSRSHSLDVIDESLGKVLESLYRYQSSRTSGE
ncbi:response regulator [Bacterioplanes sanyensis]|uniref:Response regulator n=1 Tax=Bacterioplanes sanyensis TaxID=1249553 RepID=A0A222FL94_9GAMM|nr:response regulator [Bacterioplanes sanyensis]ASP39550.1 response regulator [Bacterioplanes sanyensis]